MPPNNVAPADSLRQRLVRPAAGVAVALALVSVAATLLVADHFRLLDAPLESACDAGSSGAMGNAAPIKDAGSGSPVSEDRPPYYPGNAEEYAYQMEPGFVSTAVAPLSTLAADVDTASYCNLRRMVREGAGPAQIPAGAVRTEEMLNYFDYDWAAPQDGDLFGVTAQMADCPWNPATKLLVMGFATDPGAAAPSEGSNLVFLVDTSGSMGEPYKLDLLKEAFATMAEGLSERDRVSMVTYSGSERVVLQGVDGADKQAILRAIDSLKAEGSTNGEAGLKTAYRLAEEQFIEGGTNRIVMASDGDLNVGISSADELHAFVDAKRESGVYLSVLGFGTGNYKDDRMETLADHGNGSYHYIDSVAEAKRVLGRNLRANLVPLADDVKLQVEFNPEKVKGYRLIGYENRALAPEDFLDESADAGEVGAGHAFTVAYEVAPADSPMKLDVPALKYGARGTGTDAGDAGGPDAADEIAICTDGIEWLTCSMRYRPAGKDETATQAYVMDDSADVAEPNADWRFAAAVIECSMLLRGSDFAGSASYAAALKLADAADDPARVEFAALLEALARREALGGAAGSAYRG